MKQDLIWEFYQNELPHVMDGNWGRLSFLASKIEPGSRCLNIGIGNGAFERICAARKIDIYSLDPSENAVRQLQSELGLGDKARVGYSQEIPFESGFFDAIVMSEVLEHLPEEVLNATVHEVARVLKPGGRFLGTVPARERLQENVVLCPHCGEHFHRWGHEQTFDLARMRSYLQGPLEVVTAEERIFPAWRRLNWLQKIEAAIRTVLWWAGAPLANQNIFFVARKK